MGKKKSRPRLSEAQLYQPGVDAIGEKGSGVDEQNLSEEYRYVITNLKRIGALALVMLALLTALAFVLV